MGNIRYGIRQVMLVLLQCIRLLPQPYRHFINLDFQQL